MRDNRTSFANRCSILSELWMEHRSDPGLSNFMEHNDIGLPLAFAVAEELVLPSDVAMNLINQTFEMFLSSLGASDEGYNSLDDLKLGEELTALANGTYRRLLFIAD